MPSSRPAMYNTPHIRNGGFGALQVEAMTNRPLSIARRHLAASQLRMRDIEPDELSSSEWVRFLVMQDMERQRWMNEFRRRRGRRDSGESSSSSSSSSSSASGGSAAGGVDREVAYDKAEEARAEAEEEARRVEGEARSLAAPVVSLTEAPVGTTPPVSLWVRQFDEGERQGRARRPASPAHTAQRPMHARRAVTEGITEALPTYESAVRARTPPPAYEPRREEGSMSPLLP